MDNHANKKISYQDAGVNIEKGNELVRRLKKTIDNTHKKEVIGGLGGFGGLFDLGSLSYKQPILVSGTDGVGTKIKLAIENNMHSTIGIDLVAMCVNDIIVQGAKPLFFLDYFACSKLDINVAETVINGIGAGCSLAGCSLIGGETAEMPGMYREQDYDLAGFCVGAVEKDEIITGENVVAGDALIALASSGCHSNGYSLIRKIIKDTNSDLTQNIDGKKLLGHLLEPTRIYAKQILNLIQYTPIKSIAHITGGGLIENLPRVMPKDLSVVIDTNTWSLPPIFNWLSEQGKIDSHEMFKTFNCGVGLVLCVEQKNTDKTINYLNNNGETAWVIGEVIKNNKRVKVQLK
jgi:phosphoribosylformylglycinamidine cyclo-ligase